MSTQRTKSSKKDLRVLKRNMIYCSGLPSSITENDLISQTYFGQFGIIQKIVISPFPNRNYCSTYITFAHQFQAAIAILSCNEYQVERSILWCLFGTMKYCTFFLKKVQCKNTPNCPYLHVMDKENEIQIKNSPSEAFPLHIKLAKEVINKFPQKVKKLRQIKNIQGKLPSPLKIFQYFSIIEDKIIEKQQRIIKKKTQQSNQKKIDITCKKLQKMEINLEQRIKRMLIAQLQKNNGSRVIKNAKIEQIKLRQKIMLQLKK